jgi:hypothetical protein
MKLTLKKEFLEFSINGGGRNIKRKLKNVHPSEFEKLYNSGYKDFFDVSDIDISKDDLNSLDAIKTTKKKEKIDDTNITE